MANRMISYGYGTENGEIVVIPSEAEVVKWVFLQYTSGKILKDIAAELTERGVEFYDGNCCWNKNTVVRIIQNGKYIGEKNYPVIIDFDLFEKANKQKTDKGHKKEKPSEIIEYLKNVVYCGDCGKIMHRRVTWGIREKWLCQAGCKCEKYIDDSFILHGIHKILRAASENPQLLEKYESAPTYTKTQEIIRFTNEIGRYMNERAPSFKTGKKLIMACATEKFSACRYNATATIAEFITAQLASDSEYLQKVFLQKIVDKIIINHDGTISIRFIGGIVVADTETGEQYGSAS